MMSEKHPFVITEIGGGNSGHVCVSLFEDNSKGRVKTQLLSGRPELWVNLKPRVRLPDGNVQEGKIAEVSNQPAKLIPNSDIVLWTGPVSGTREVFEKIQPYVVPHRTVVGTIFAQGP